MDYIGNILYDSLLLENDNDIIIFGTGKCGRKILEYLQVNQKEKNIQGFCDSDKEKIGCYIDKIPVFYSVEAFKKFPNASYLISGRYAEEMLKILQENKIRKTHFLFL